ncbi:MAG: AgmX/PglI C-terminal domain-containing protein [Usitatibacter sp.]
MRKIVAILLMLVAASALAAKQLPPVLEKLSTLDIHKVIDAHKPDIDKCVREQKKRDPAIGGKMRVRWAIQPDGSVLYARVETLEFSKSTVGKCVATAIGKWKFPKHQVRGSPVEHPFTF